MVLRKTIERKRPLCRLVGTARFTNLVSAKAETLNKESLGKFSEMSMGPCMVSMYIATEVSASLQPSFTSAIPFAEQLVSEVVVGDGVRDSGIW